MGVVNESRHVSRVMESSPEEVYAFAAVPENLHLWAAGLAEAPVRVADGEVVVDSPMGQVRVRFVAENPYGVLDHDVRLPSGEVVNNPMRVIAHPAGAEVIFTVRRRDMTGEAFEADCRAVAADLDRLAECVGS